MAAVAQEGPPASLLSRLLNANQGELSSMLRQMAGPLALPFVIPPPLLGTPNGSLTQPRFNGKALLEYHMEQARRLAANDVVATAGLLGQPQPSAECPAAPCLIRSQV